MRRGRVSVWVVAGAMLLACGATAAQSATKRVRRGPYNVALFGTKTEQYSAAEAAAVMKEAKKFNMKITFFDSALDPDTQYNQLEDALTLHKFQGFLIAPANGATLVGPVRQAVKDGIKVVGFAMPLGPDPYSASVQIPGVSAEVTTAPTTRGKWLGEQMIGACTGIDPCYVAYLAGAAGLPIEEGTEKGYVAAIKPHRNIHNVGFFAPTGYTVAGGQKLAADLLTAHPNMNVIAASGDAVGGVILALKAAHRSFGTGKGQVRVLAGGTPCSTIDAIKAGQIYSAQPNAPDQEADAAVEALAAALHGSKRVEAIDPIAAAKIPPVISKANVSHFRCEF